MPTLFISYKRKTSAVAPLMERLRAAYYRLWFDRDEIHLGDPDWQARIDQGLQRCDGVILNITPDACASEPVRYEVRKALELGKPIFPVILERIADYNAAIHDLGLPEKQHLEDFTDVSQWDEQIQRLLRDLEEQGLGVTPHDRRQERSRDNLNYVLHQTYLKRLAEHIGTLNLAQINPTHAQGVELERVYVDSPTGLGISVEVQDWQVLDWWIDEGEQQERGLFGLGDDSKPDDPRRKPSELGYETAPFEAIVGRIDSAIARYREENPDAKPDEEYSWNNPWNNGVKRHVVNIHLNHLAAARNRLVILGAPGSGKSTFVRYIALCLAGSGVDDWTRNATITALDNWSHGILTPVYVELRRFVASEHFPSDVKTPATADHLWAYIIQDILGADLQAYAEDLRYDLEHGLAVLILDGLDEVPYPEGKLKDRQNQLINLAHSLNTRYATSRIIVASRPYAYEGWTLPSFEVAEITEFTDQHRADLAKRLYQVAGLDEKSAKEKAQALNTQLRQIDPELKDRPLFVTLMATIYLKGEQEGLPTRRGALYRESILLLLDRWTASKPDAPSLVKLLGDKSLDDLYDRLSALAYAVHSSYGDQPGTPEIDESLLYKYLKPLGRTTAA
ncbi:MAG: TIR domain-containing protein, partial [Anaerolineae bacterium]|nr:TIR domain-containing protein [Anaerolineae bacterium]